LREEPRHDAGAMAPAGQLWSTLDDLARWATVLAGSESSGAAGRGSPESSVLAAATLAEMRTPVVLADLDSWTAGYGLGLQLWRRGERVYLGHTGSMPGYLAVVVVHRPSSTGVLVFVNSYSLAGNTIGQLGLSIMDEVLAGEPAPYPVPWRPSQPPPADVEGVCGRWWWMGREFEVGWDDRNAQLTVHSIRNSEQPWRFSQQDTDRWRGETGEQAGEVLRILRDEHGTPFAVDIATFVFSRDPLPPL
jgi:CubicO group peptidase (beta-lactamase class C family)